MEQSPIEEKEAPIVGTITCSTRARRVSLTAEQQTPCDTIPIRTAGPAPFLGGYDAILSMLDHKKEAVKHSEEWIMKWITLFVVVTYMRSLYLVSKTRPRKVDLMRVYTLYCSAGDVLGVPVKRGNTLEEKWEILTPIRQLLHERWENQYTYAGELEKFMVF